MSKKTPAALLVLRELYHESKKKRSMGWHWHMWNLLLAMTPAAGVYLMFGGTKREQSVPWVSNNRGLAERIENLEKASFGEAIDDSPEADKQRVEDILQISRQRSEAIRQAAAADEVGANGGAPGAESAGAGAAVDSSELWGAVRSLEERLDKAIAILERIRGGDGAAPGPGDAGGAAKGQAGSVGSATPATPAPTPPAKPLGGGGGAVQPASAAAGAVGRAPAVVRRHPVEEGAT